MQHKILRTYDKAWHFERKLYAIDDIKLPFPVNLDEMVYLAAGLFFMFLLCKLIPPLAGAPFLVRYLFAPWLLMKFLTKKKFDGKLAHSFVLGYIDYVGLPKQISRFTDAREYKKGCFTRVVYRQKMIVDRTSFELKKKGGGNKHV